jgi:hypothetical protein
MPRINLPLIIKAISIALPTLIIIYLSTDLTQMSDTLASLYNIILYGLSVPLYFLVYIIYPDWIELATVSDVFIITSSLIFFFVAPSSLLSLLIHKTTGFKQRPSTYVFAFCIVLLIVFLTLTSITEGILSYFVTIALSLILFIGIGNYLLIKLTSFLIRKNVFRQINTPLVLGLCISFAWSIYFPYHFQVIQTKAITATTELVQKTRSQDLNDLTLSEFNELKSQINKNVNSTDYLSNQWSNVVQNNQITLTGSTKDYISAMTFPHYASENMRTEDILREKRNIMGSLAFQSIINEIASVCKDSVNVFEFTFTQNSRSEENQPESYKLIFIGEKLVQKNQLLNPDIVSITDQNNIEVCSQDVSPLTQTIFVDKKEYSDVYKKFIDDLETLPEQERIKAITEAYVEALDVKRVEKVDNSVRFELNTENNSM